MTLLFGKDFRLVNRLIPILLRHLAKVANHRLAASFDSCEGVLLLSSFNLDRWFDQRLVVVIVKNVVVRRTRECAHLVAQSYEVGLCFFPNVVVTFEKRLILSALGLYLLRRGHCIVLRRERLRVDLFLLILGRCGLLRWRNKWWALNDGALIFLAATWLIEAILSPSVALAAWRFVSNDNTNAHISRVLSVHAWPRRSRITLRLLFLVTAASNRLLPNLFRLRK